MPETDIHTKAGESATDVITAPEKPGDYRIFCATDGHAEMDMVGTLTVQASAPTDTR